MLLYTKRVQYCTFYHTLLQPCPLDSPVESELITQRATETCTHMKQNNLYEVTGLNSSDFLETGTKYSEKGKYLPNIHLSYEIHILILHFKHVLI